MKILYYYPEVGSPMFQWQRFHFIDELQRYGIYFTIFNPLLYDNFDVATEEIISILRQEPYDLFFTNLCNPKHISLEVLKFCKRRGIPTLSFRSDNYVIPFLDEKLSKYFDLVWITSQETKFLYDKFGARTVFAPYAANPFFFKYREESPLVKKACFVGTPHSSRANFINQLTEACIPVDAFYKKNSITTLDNEVQPKWDLQMPGLLKYYFDLFRFGAGRTMFLASLLNRIKKQTTLVNNKYLGEYSKVPFESISEIYSKYALSLAFTSLQHTDVLKQPIKIVDLRNFEVPMCGGILFCRYHEEMASYFEPSKEIVMYESKEELIDKASFYLNKASEQELRNMKIAARSRAENEHSWKCRFKLVFDTLGLKQVF